MIINVYCSSCKSTRYSCHVLMNLEFSRQIVERHSNVKFRENSPSGSQVTPWGHTHYTANSRFSQFCERA